MATTAYERVIADEALRRSVQQKFAGDGDVIDELWWVDHPDDAAPSGRESPLAQIRVLQRNAYAADGRDRDGAAHQLAEAQKRRSMQRRFALEAVTAADAAVVLQSAAMRGTAQGTHPSSEQASSSERESKPERDSKPAPASRGRIVLVAAAALAAGLLIGGAIGAALPKGVPSEASAPTGTSTSTEAAVDQAPAVASIFDRPQEPNDLPAVALAPSFRSESFRLLSPGDEFGPSAYAARDDSGQVCLIVIPPERTYLSSCVLEGSIARAPLRLSWEAPITSRNADGSPGEQSPGDWLLVWQGGESLSGTAAARKP
ncbi:hypothetical protein WDJ51_06105 [Rathayibacter sp. YIM 133350]|uniref:hypothetical protein n=1 Tax=Rathayibacter sp. YIM 133350 TaxID=3131992 RepID=UPI00307F6BDB